MSVDPATAPVRPAYIRAADGNYYRIGGGTPGMDQTAADARYEQLTRKNAASGYVGLDSGSKIAFIQIPTGTTSTTVALGNHLHAGVYDPAGTASSAVSTHASTAGHELLSSTTPAALTPDIAGAIGSGTTVAKADHVHNVPAAAPTTNLTATTTNAEGSGTSFARNDHTHAIDTATPVALGGANALGSLTSLARSDHVHIYPTAAQLQVLSLSGGTLTGPLITAASIAGASGLRIPHGTAPSAPTNGDFWTTTAGVYARVNGATVGPLGAGGGGGLPTTGGTMTGNILMAGNTGIGPSVVSGSDALKWGSGFPLQRVSLTSSGWMDITASSEYLGISAPDEGVKITGHVQLYTGTLTTLAAAAAAAGLRIPHGAAPTAPVNGDFWTTTAGVYARVNGATQTLASQAWTQSNFHGTGSSITVYGITVDPPSGSAQITLDRGATTDISSVMHSQALVGKWQTGMQASTTNYAIKNIVTSVLALEIDSTTDLVVVKGNPTANLGIATKQYVDSIAGISQAAADTRYVNVAGDTMTGVLSLGDDLNFVLTSNDTSKIAWTGNTFIDGDNAWGSEHLNVSSHEVSVIGTNTISLQAPVVNLPATGIVFNGTSNISNEWGSFSISASTGNDLGLQVSGTQKIWFSSGDTQKIDMGDSQLQHVLDPTLANDAATKAYVDSKTILSGTAAPSSGTGAVGNYYLDTDDRILYGPKSAGGAVSFLAATPSTSYTIVVSEVLGIRFQALTNGNVTGLRFYRNASATQTARELKLWNDAGTLLGSGVTSGETGAGWHSITLSTPVALIAGTYYQVGHVNTANSRYAQSPLPIVSGSAHFANLTPRYGTNTSSAPTGAGYDNYFVDVLFEPAGAPWPVALYGTPTPFTVGTTAPSGPVLNSVWIDTT